MYLEDELLPISALQHVLYCERQCALIHVERVWEENLFTVEGRILHDTVDSGENSVRAGRRIARSLPLRSLSLGLSGIADVVEFGPGRTEVLPVEYKRGRSKSADWDRVQLCAQAMCLEEMLGVEIRQGALFYGKTKRREQVVFDDELRGETRETAERLRRLIEAGRTPPAVYSDKCDACSLFHVCMPKLPKSKSISRYLATMADAE
jgi:CRISPR-associated exonuclease Cas4